MTRCCKIYILLSAGSNLAVGLLSMEGGYRHNLLRL